MSIKLRERVGVVVMRAGRAFGIGTTPDIQKNKLRSIQEGIKSRYGPSFFSAPGIKEEQVLTSSRETLAQGEVDGDLCSVGIGEHALLAAIFSTAMLS